MHLMILLSYKAEDCVVVGICASAVLLLLHLMTLDVSSFVFCSSWTSNTLANFPFPGV